MCVVSPKHGRRSAEGCWLCSGGQIPPVHVTGELIEALGRWEVRASWWDWRNKRQLNAQKDSEIGDFVLWKDTPWSLTEVLRKIKFLLLANTVEHPNETSLDSFRCLPLGAAYIVKGLEQVKQFPHRQPKGIFFFRCCSSLAVILGGLKDLWNESN